MSYVVKIGQMYLCGYTFLAGKEHEAERPEWSLCRRDATPFQHRWLASTLAEKWGGRLVRRVPKRVPRLANPKNGEKR